MRDVTLEDTVYFFFTTRAFATGIPTALLGTPVLSVIESNNATPITTGVSVTVDRASVTGLNQATVILAAAQGFETRKSYAVYISTGTVGGVSVVGEVVAEFTIQDAAAAVDLANATDGLGALKTLIDAVDDLVDTEVAAIKSDTAAILLDTGTDGVIVASLAANSVTASALNADAATEIAAAVWDKDATAHQTQGTFGQAIGDPAADTNTIYKAVVTDATGATVGVDVVAIKAETVNILADTDVIGAAGAGLTALATQASVNTVDDFLDTEIAAIKAKTDSLTFTVAGQVDANIQYVNDVAVTGTGAPGTEWGP